MTPKVLSPKVFSIQAATASPQRGSSTADQQLADAIAYAQQPRIQLVFLRCFLEASRSSEVLIQQYRKAQKRNQYGKDTPLTDALWAGHRALLTEAEACAQALTERGQLLFAFEGTTVLQGGAQ